jgi:hypothetical protein
VAVAGRGLTKKEKAGQPFLPIREGWLDLPSGRLRLESLNSLAIQGEQTTDRGAEIVVEPGRYRVCVETLNHGDADPDGIEGELPSDFIRLVRLADAASPDLDPLLRLPDATVTEAAAPIIVGDVLTTETVRSAASTTALLLRCDPAQTEALGLGLGDRVAIAIGDGEIEAAFSGFLTPTALERLLGLPRPLGSGGMLPNWLAHFAFLDGAAPIVIELERREAPRPAEEAPTTGSEASLRRLGGDGLPAFAGDLVDKARMQGGQLHAHALFAAPGTLLLNVAFKHLRKLGITAMRPDEAPLMLKIGAQARTIRLDLRRRPDALSQAQETYFAELAHGEALHAKLTLSVAWISYPYPYPYPLSVPLSVSVGQAADLGQGGGEVRLEAADAGGVVVDRGGLPRVLVDDVLPRVQRGVVRVHRPGEGDAAGGALVGLNAVDRDVADIALGGALEIGVAATVGDEDVVIGEAAEIDAADHRRLRPMQRQHGREDAAQQQSADAAAASRRTLARRAHVWFLTGACAPREDACQRAQDAGLAIDHIGLVHVQPRP